MYLGADYYPEQWDPSLMDSDLDSIKELGANVIRIGEFAWHLMEREEGRFDFSFFDRVIEKAKKRGLKVIMGTPTASIPAWLAKAHPDILSEFEDGSKRAFGGRHGACCNSRHMYEYSEKIIRALVSHYKDEPQIIAWQVDNEIGHEGSDLCFCPSCREAFRAFLKEKFSGDIEKLNETYGTAFWSQEYNDFDEIPIPSRTVTTHNPSLRLDWERFRSQTLVNFIKFQCQVVREEAPGAFLIHDFPGGGLEKHVDYSRAAEPLDLAAYNNYPVWGGQKDPLPPSEIAFGLDHIRGLKGKNFWITEAIMGAQGHDVTGCSPRPNQAKMWSYQAMARGCSSLLYFRFRGAAKGAEQFCYGILDTDNQKRRKFYEAQSFFHEIRSYESLFDTPVKAEAAILYDYDSLASFRIQKQSILLDCTKEMKRFHHFLYRQNIMTDVIASHQDFSGYKLIILPLMTVVTKEFCKRLQTFAASGGTVIMTYRTAVKNQDNNLEFGQLLPLGCLKIAGVHVEEAESLQETNAFPLRAAKDSLPPSGFGGIFRDFLVSDTAEVLYRYQDPFYEDYAAITRNAFGDGFVYYIGCSADDAVTARVVQMALQDSGISGISSPEGVEIVRRGEGADSAAVCINHNAFPVSFGDTKLEAFESKILPQTPSFP